MRFSSPLWPVWIPAIVALVLIVRGWRSFLDFMVVSWWPLRLELSLICSNNAT
jgi:hypothetical protein